MSVMVCADLVRSIFTRRLKWVSCWQPAWCTMSSLFSYSSVILWQIIRSCRLGSKYSQKSGLSFPRIFGKYFSGPVVEWSWSADLIYCGFQSETLSGSAQNNCVQNNPSLRRWLQTLLQAWSQLAPSARRMPPVDCDSGLGIVSGRLCIFLTMFLTI